jgi:hypothetical protein
MNNVNNSSNNEEEEETKLRIDSLLTDMIIKVLLMRQQHLAKLNRERVRRCREQKRKKRQAYRSHNEEFLESYA